MEVRSTAFESSRNTQKLGNSLVSARRELDKLDDPGYLRRHGVVIVSPAVLEAHSAPIGRYQDREIWGSVTFKGMRYRFDRVVSEKERERISARELYLAPGLVYVTD